MKSVSKSVSQYVSKFSALLALIRLVRHLVRLPQQIPPLLPAVLLKRSLILRSFLRPVVRSALDQTPAGMNERGVGGSKGRGSDVSYLSHLSRAILVILVTLQMERLR